MARFADFLARLRGDDRDPERARLLAILGLNRQLARAEGRRQLLTLLLDEAVHLFGAERGFLVVTAPEEPGFRVELARSLDREPVQHPERKVSGTIVRRALAGAPVHSEDAQDGELGGAQSIADLKLRSVLCTPLQVGERVTGCLYLDHRFQSGAFGERDLPWLMAFADQGAIALHLHELLAQVRDQAARLQASHDELLRTVAAQAEQLVELQPAVQRSALRHAFPAIVGEAPALVRALQLLDRIVDGDFPVLVTGESGTGKELVARALHEAGPRRRGPFVALNMAAVPPALLESELFGHKRGAFTGADRDRQGLLLQAEGGVVFLDEITEMDLEVQARLLRALEERQVRPLGGDRTVPFDARIVAATNREPRAAIAAGRLREDLFFRLAVVQVALPPLRERRQDIPVLAAHFAAAIAAERGRPAPTLPRELLTALSARAWPGNLRELRNEVQRLLALAGDTVPDATMLSPDPGVVSAAGAPPGLDLAALERWAVARALAAAGGNKAEAARLLGISRRTLYSKLAETPPDEPPAS